MAQAKNEIVFPDFLGIGAQKSGTTTLFHLLKEHPEVYIPEKKELNFFQVDSTYKNGIQWYARKFFDQEKAAKARSVGEITPTYLNYAKIPARIYESLGGHVKFLCILREPVQRAYSHFLMLKKAGKVQGSFQKALQKEQEGEANTRLIANSIYGEQFKHYFECFSRDQFLIYEFEHFKKAPDQVKKELSEFLNLSPFPEEASRSKPKNQGAMPRWGSSSLLFRRPPFIEALWRKIKRIPFLERAAKKMFLKDPPELSEKEREKIRESYFETDIQELEAITGFSFDTWRNSSKERAAR